jgi:hypothetical protein
MVATSRGREKLMLQGTPEYLSAHTGELNRARATPAARAAIAQRRAERRRSLGGVAPLRGLRRTRGASLRARYVSATGVIVVVAIALVTAACGGGDEPSADSVTTIEPTSTTAAQTTTQAAVATTQAAPATTQPPPIEITAVDYAYEGLPEVVPAGTRLTLVNASTEAFHSALVIRLRPDDDRTVEELAALDLFDIVDETGTDFKIGTVQAMFAAAPGKEGYAIALGSPTVFNPGRYVVLDIFPVGADPVEAKQRAEYGPPTPEQLEGTIPHYQAGLIAEFTVEG